MKSYPWASTVAMSLDEFDKFPTLSDSQRTKRDKRLFHICNLPLRLCSLYYQTYVPSLWISLSPMP